jgi:AraC-like DNA-binding protein
MLAPSDEHIFDIEEATQFTVLKFSNIYLSQQNGNTRINWDEAIERLILLSKEHHLSLISDAQLKNLSDIMYLIAREWQQDPSPSNEVILHLTRAAVSLMIRATEKETLVAASPSSERLSQALHYIHLHISDPEQLHTESIASQVQLSKARLTALFKQETGMSIKDYINEYKFRQIENKLKYSAQTIKEISNEFAFADLSHLNKFVRRMKGLTPRDYRTLLKTGG